VSEEPRELSEEELLEELKKIRVQDVLLQTAVSLINLSGRKLAVEEEKDVEQARLGIEAVRVLLPLLPEEESKPIKDALSQIQMMFVRQTSDVGRQEEKPESRIWTPPGTSTS
jgi:hypothetical protein